MQTLASSLPWRRPANSRRRAGRRPLISLTPLIDVVFILLVFFMLASSFLDWRAIELDAPAAATTAATSDEGALWVEVRADGLRLGGETLSLDALVGRVETRLRERPEQRVLIRPAAGLALQDAVRVIDRLAAVGVEHLSLAGDGR